MKTHERAHQLASAASAFPYLGLSEPGQLLDVVRAELGHEDVLDDFQRYGSHLAKAVAPGTILHVLSGNTPHAALQSLIRGLLLGARNLCKLPSCGLPAIEEFRSRLPEPLREAVEISPQGESWWWENADVVIAFGSDETIRAVRARVAEKRIFIAHGHAVSLALIYEDPELRSVALAARDAALFDQQGCLSPHGFHVRQNAAEYAERLAAEMEKIEAEMPRAALSAEDSASIRSMREEYAFRAATTPDLRLHRSRDSTAWTVVFDPDPAFRSSPLNRFLFVRPWPEDFASALAEVRPHLSAIGIWPATCENAIHAATLGASRICPVGQMQTPPFTWHQDGRQALAPLVRWIDAEVG